MTGDFVFYAYSAMGNRIGFNSVLNGYLIGMSQLLALPIAFIVCHSMPRQKSGLITFGTISILNIALSFINRPDTCIYCSEAIWQIVLVMVSSFCVEFQFVFIFQHLIEFYPTTIRTIGMGIPTATGAFGNFLSQLLIVSAIEKIGSAFPMVAVITALGTIAYIFAPETLNKPLTDQIEEVRQEK